LTIPGPDFRSLGLTTFLSLNTVVMVPSVVRSRVARFIPAFFVLTAALVFTGCDSGDSNEVEAAKVQVRLELDGLTPLQEGFRYRVWARVGVNNYATDPFNVTETGSYLNDAGQFVQNTFTFPVDVAEAREIYVSIEDKGGNDEQPSDTIVLGGEVSGSSASMSTEYDRSIGTSFAGESGQFMLFTPSDLDTNNETQGVWFATGSIPNLVAGLDLPVLPDGWIYESWVNVNGTLLSMGKFTSGSGQDLARPHSEPDTPRFPGEDFLLNPPDGVTFPLDLSGAQVLITVEPNPDDVISPLGLQIMSGTIPSTPAPMTPYPISADLQLPSGTATLF